MLSSISPCASTKTAISKKICKKGEPVKFAFAQMIPYNVLLDKETEFD